MLKLIVSCALTLISIYIFAFKNFWLGLFFMIIGSIAIYLNTERLKNV